MGVEGDEMEIPCVNEEERERILCNKIFRSSTGIQIVQFNLARTKFICTRKAFEEFSSKYLRDSLHNQQTPFEMVKIEDAK
jgi:hypothetical protein